VRKYFASIDHEILKSLLEKAVKCRPALDLAAQIIDGFTALAEMKDAIEGFLDTFRLRIHDRKSRVYRCADGVTFLGWRVFPGRARLVRESVAAFRRRLREMELAFAQGRASRADVRTRIHSWIGHAGSGDTWRLRKQLFESFTLVKGSGA
jgi:hypothetical protein